MLHATLLFSLLAGCAMPEETFWDKQVETNCAVAVSCAVEESEYADVDECIDDARIDNNPVKDNCDYDGKAARDCIDGMEAWAADGCPVKQDDDLADLIDRCDVVYDC